MTEDSETLERPIRSAQHNAMAAGIREEVELKLEIDAADAPRIKRLRAVGGDARTELLRAIYYDTAKKKLHKNGYSLRVRHEGERFVQTVKTQDTGAGLFARGEWEAEVASLDPDLAALADTPLRELAGAGDLNKLRAIIESKVERTAWIVREDESSIEVAFDQGTITANGSEDRILEIELELLEGETRAAVQLAQSIAEEVPVRIGVLTKAERGLRLVEGTAFKLAKATPIEIRGEATVGQAFAVIAQACLKHFRLNEPLIHAGRDPGALHQARVAMRRLRSAFTMFKRAIADGEFVRLRDELRWFTAQLGDARNLDVYLQRDLATDERAPVNARREKAYDRIIETLNSRRFRGLMLDLVVWSSLGAWRSGRKAQRPVAPFAAKRLDALWRRVASAGDLAEMDEESRHRLRIEAKKLRYALEFFETLSKDLAKEQKRFADAVKNLQEALGKLNDMATARALSAKLPEVQSDGDRGDEAEERGHLKAAERELRRMRKIGAYWSVQTAG
jgi:inorganic triphosphatase YgiF